MSVRQEDITKVYPNGVRATTRSACMLSRARYTGWFTRSPSYRSGWPTRTVLPIYPLAQIMRANVTNGLAHDVAASYAVLAAWTVAAWATTAWVIGRR